MAGEGVGGLSSSVFVDSASLTAMGAISKFGSMQCRTVQYRTVCNELNQIELLATNCNKHVQTPNPLCVVAEHGDAMRLVRARRPTSHTETATPCSSPVILLFPTFVCMLVIGRTSFMWNGERLSPILSVVLVPIPTGQAAVLQRPLRPPDHPMIDPTSGRPVVLTPCARPLAAVQSSVCTCLLRSIARS